MGKLKKKASVGPRKQLPAKEEEPAFGGFKLKKAETVKRQWDDGGLEGVNLKHHEFEKEPEVETPERNTDVLLGDGVPDKDGKERRKSVILQCAVSGQKDVEISWKKGGKELETTEKKTSSRYSVEKKFSEANQTMIQLEIMEADVNDSGVYELVARNAEGETQSQTVELTSEQVEMSLKAQEEAAETKAKKKKKKKKKTVEKKDLIAPEISSFLRNYILKEGEKIDIKCRLEEEIEEGDVEVTWTFNDKVITSDDRFEITFDGA